MALSLVFRPLGFTANQNLCRPVLESRLALDITVWLVQTFELVIFRINPEDNQLLKNSNVKGRHRLWIIDGKLKVLPHKAPEALRSTRQSSEF